MDDKTLHMTMLLDFYGELLTEKQRNFFEMYYNEDLSLAEMAELMGISRQGARDLIVRAEATLRETEEKIGLVKRYREQRAAINSMNEKLAELSRITEGRAKELALSIKDELLTMEN
jgi:predicted DNA-binding protein YlxM (UPF0122 family)